MQVVVVVLTLLLQVAVSRKLCDRQAIEEATITGDSLVCRVGVLAIRGRETAFNSYNATFGEYLSAVVGDINGVAVSFELVPIEFQQDINPIDEFRPSKVDFVFANPSIFSCVESLHGAAPLATFINQRNVNNQVYELEQFGGVIFTRKDNDEIDSIQDIKGRRIGSVSISGLGSGQMQFRELQRAGVHYLQDPAQLTFMENQGTIIHGVLTDQIDVGFVRTDQLERYIDRRTGRPLDLSLVKIIEPKTDVIMTNGEVFPFPMSSSVLYPEWPLAAMPHVDRQLVSAVQARLFDMKDLASTSGPLGWLTNRAFSTGRYAGWSPALSYLELRNLHRELGILDRDNYCIAGTEIKDAIVCKPGYYQRDSKQLYGQCALEGLDCYGFECICKPCVARPPVEFAPIDVEQSCAKFDVCGVVEQGDRLSFVLVDNLQREDAVVSIEIFFGKESEAVDLSRFPNETFRYEFVFDASGRKIDVAILDIYINGKQIDLSPVRLDIVQRDCFADTGNPRRIPDIVGRCVCDDTSVAFGQSSCFPKRALAAIIMAPILVLFAILVHHYIRRKHLEARFWLIGQQELHFDETPRILGSGSFGCVLEATYRGTRVAVKRAMPSNKRVNCDSEIHNVFRENSLRFKTSTHEEMNNWSQHTSFDGLGASRLSSGSVLFRSIASRRIFQEEMQTMAKLRHPCITTLIGAVLEKSMEPVIVMELMEWGSLYDLLHNETLVIEPETIIAILLDVISGIRFLHSAQPEILHKDLKSSNVLVDSKFRAKISDFGFSHTKDVEAVGTIEYRSPELLEAVSSNTTASDIYAFGIIMTEVLSRKSPYEGFNLKEIMSEIIDPEVNRRPYIPNDAAPSVVRLVKDCLAADPSARPIAAAIEVRLNVFQSEGQSQALLYQIFPKHIADDLRRGKKPELERFEIVTVFFSDIVGYTAIASNLLPEQVSDLLDRLYSKFDDLCNKFNIFKVETIGDAYMTVTNLAENQIDHAERMVDFAFEAIKVASTTPISETDLSLGYVEIRVGIHSGPVVAQVVGSRTPRYSVIGDTVNIAARYESSSKPGCIHCSQETAQLLEMCQRFDLLHRGEVQMKGKGGMRGFWVGHGNHTKRDMEQTHTSDDDGLSMVSI